MRRCFARRRGTRPTTHKKSPRPLGTGRQRTNQTGFAQAPLRHSECAAAFFARIKATRTRSASEGISPTTEEFQEEEKHPQISQRKRMKFREPASSYSSTSGTTASGRQPLPCHRDPDNELSDGKGQRPDTIPAQANGLRSISNRVVLRAEGPTRLADRFAKLIGSGLQPSRELVSCFVYQSRLACAWYGGAPSVLVVLCSCPIWHNVEQEK